MKYLLKKYLYTDMDGTLIGDNKQISERNIQALRRFVDAGGIFSVASGRNVAIARPYLRDLPINAPAILYNGAGVYDFAQERFLHKEILGEGLARGILSLAMEVYPGGCPQIFCEGAIRLLNRDGVMDHYIAEEQQPYEFVPLEDACHGAFKAMVYGEPDQLERVRAAVLERFGESQFVWMYSAPFYLEFLPPNATKGAALRWIEAELGYAREDVAAIGDYYNDVQLLKAASLGAAVSNAPDDVKQAADVVVVDNNHHALEYFIDSYLLV